jgi:hypothetical protein
MAIAAAVATIAAAITAAVKLCNAATAARTEAAAAANARRRSCGTCASAGVIGFGAAGILGELAVGATIGKTRAIAAAVLKTLRLIIVGSICGTHSNPWTGPTFPSLAPFVHPTACQTGAVREMNGLRLFRDIASRLRHAVSSGRPAGLPRRYWTIRTADGIRVCSASPTGQAL